MKLPKNPIDRGLRAEPGGWGVIITSLFCRAGLGYFLTPTQQKMGADEMTQQGLLLVNNEFDMSHGPCQTILIWQGLFCLMSSGQRLPTIIWWCPSLPFAHRAEKPYYKSILSFLCASLPLAYRDENGFTVVFLAR